GRPLSPTRRSSDLSCTRRASSWKFFWLHCHTASGAPMASTSASSASQSAARPAGFDAAAGRDAATGAGGWGGGAEAPAPVVAPEADEAAALVSALPPGLAPGFASTACPAGELAVFAPDLPSPSAFDPACGATFGSAFGATGGPLDASCG